MGCDMTIDAYKMTDNGPVIVGHSAGYLDWRNYEIYAFLADVRNKVGITPITEPRDWPSWLPLRRELEREWWGDGPSYGGWLKVAELLEFDYNKTIESGETYRDLLSEGFFDELERMRADGVTHIVMWFSS